MTKRLTFSITWLGRTQDPLLLWRVTEEEDCGDDGDSRSQKGVVDGWFRHARLWKERIFCLCKCWNYYFWLVIYLNVLVQILGNVIEFVQIISSHKYTYSFMYVFIYLETQGEKWKSGRRKCGRDRQIRKTKRKKPLLPESRLLFNVAKSHSRTWSCYGVSCALVNVSWLNWERKDSYIKHRWDDEHSPSKNPRDPLHYRQLRAQQTLEIRVS